MKIAAIAHNDLKKSLLAPDSNWRTVYATAKRARAAGDVKARLWEAALDEYLRGRRVNNPTQEPDGRILSIALDEFCTTAQKEFILHYFADRMTLAEIAVRHSVSTATACSTIHTGLANAGHALYFVCHCLSLPNDETETDERERNDVSQRNYA